MLLEPAARSTTTLVPTTKLLFELIPYSERNNGAIWRISEYRSGAPV
jgi:hypothetical protein